ncbi:uncharacterized protein LOC112600737 [Melanaphis sacchari]|uniref:uncharacterized protein LOC112600737 n=1 Tax=Melanaphis sacchari TaxID=742174 RepID=UPI000DC15893|nr:uncharacterized protein LOC112600737 [Melanaphis sacchari]
MEDNTEIITGDIPEVEGCMRLQPEEFVSSRQKIIIVNIYKDIISNTPDIKYLDIIKRIRELTGLGRDTVKNTISQYKTTKTVSSPNRRRAKASLFDKIDDLDRTGLRRTIHSIWLKRELPTIDRILFDVNADPSLPNFKRTSLYRVIKKLDFVFTKRKRCSVLTEREDLIVWRRKYLYDIRKYREEGRTIYYLDETWLNAGDCVDRVWKDNTVLSKHDAFNKGLTTGPQNPSGKGKRLIILHIGSENGFLPGGLLCFISKKNTGDYHDEMNGDNFKEWFENILPVLDPNSIIVMDNAPYHSVEMEKYPNASWKKAVILEWLISKNVDCERPLSSLLKPELLAISRQMRPQFKSYVIDNLAKDKGHTVLRLPPYHCEFNPIELAWAMVKGYVKQNNTTFKIDDVRQLLNTAIERVTPQNWKNFIKHVIEEECRIWKADDIMDDMIDSLEPCIMTLTGETTSSDSSE